MPLHPQARAMIDRTVALNLPPVSKMTPAEARASVRERSAALPREDVASVRDHRVAVAGGAISVRAFTPRATGRRGARVLHCGVLGGAHIETHEGTADARERRGARRG